ncbi:MAG: hypothetical protein FJ267_01310 [Planctomycetes bacterium]|nr:hypothetical protein [Planctomycetota bacterium]
MPVKVRCSNCEKVLAVPDSARGKAVKCPNCLNRIAIPADDGGSPSKSDSATKQKATERTQSPKKSEKKRSESKPARPVDSESALLHVDMRRMEDVSARICPKCGHDMKYQEEDDSECPKCGYDTEVGGLGKIAQKKQMKGPDPADFYPGLAKRAWAFVKKNMAMAWKTDLYICLCLVLSMFCAFMYRWLGAWPPKAFFLLCFAVSFLVIPGWLWLLNVEVVKLSMEKKEKFKRFNFDFFLSSASGLVFIGWYLAVGLPIVFIPGLITKILFPYAGVHPLVGAAIMGVASIPVIMLLPITMSHLAMPVTTPGFMVWKLIPALKAAFKPILVWFMWFFLGMLPFMAVAGVIVAVWGSEMNDIAMTMEGNGEIYRAKLDAEYADKGKKREAAEKRAKELGEPVEVNFTPLIGPAIITVLMVLPVGFISLFLMRINGLLTYHNKNSLGLVDMKKEYKYVAKKGQGEDDDVSDEDKPRTFQQDAIDGLAMAALALVLGMAGGMIYGNLSGDGIVFGLIAGIFWGGCFGMGIGKTTMSTAAWETSFLWGLAVRFAPLAGIPFLVMHWEKARRGFMIQAFSLPIMIVMLILAIAGIVNLGFLGNNDNGSNIPAPTQQIEGDAPAGETPQANPGAPEGAAPANNPPPSETRIDRVKDRKVILVNCPATKNQRNEASRLLVSIVSHVNHSVS